MTDSTRHARQAQITQEHEELRSLLAQVHHLLAEQVESKAVVAEKIQLLFKHVAAHFEEEEEEANGFFDQLVERAPQIADRVEQLRSEHGKMLVEMGRLSHLVSESAASDWWTRLQTEIHDFSKSLMHHENSENELLQKVYDDDLGTGD